MCDYSNEYVDRLEDSVSKMAYVMRRIIACLYTDIGEEQDAIEDVLDDVAESLGKEVGDL